MAAQSLPHNPTNVAPQSPPPFEHITVYTPPYTMARPAIKTGDKSPGTKSVHILIQYRFPITRISILQKWGIEKGSKGQ